jgi:pSer/pThr/pTyr-binding forkhead associated (FHA) protein
MKVTLTLYENAPRRALVESDEFVIGRAEDCDLQLASPLVSRHHCELTMHEGRLYVRDLESRNGTGLNNQTVVGRRLLQDGDELWVAATPVKIHIETTRHAPGLIHKAFGMLYSLQDESDSTPPFQSNATAR